MGASYLALAVVAGLAAIERKGFLQAMLSRPVALGTIVGAVLGDPATGLAVGIPLELLWLGAVNMGAALPIHEALGAASSAGGAVLGLRALSASPSAAGAEPAAVAAVAVLSIAVCLPLAWIGRRADAWMEAWNDHLYDRAERELARGDPRLAVRANLYGVGIPFAVAFALAPVGAAIAAAVARGVVAAAPGLVQPLAVGWIAFGGLACASGARSMRSRKAPLGFAAGLGAAVALAVAWVATGGSR